MTEVKNLNLDVIATFEDMEQEIFQIKFLTKDITKFIKKHPIVKESIESNGKYVFGSWA